MNFPSVTLAMYDSNKIDLNLFTDEVLFCHASFRQYIFHKNDMYKIYLPILLYLHSCCQEGVVILSVVVVVGLLVDGGDHQIVDDGFMVVVGFSLLLVIHQGLLVVLCVVLGVVVHQGLVVVGF